jgi:hypothetical protein
MKRLSRFLLIMTTLAIVSPRATAQTYPRPEIQVEDFIENLFNLQSTDANYEDLYEQLLLLYSTPLDLNSATPEELRNTYILSEKQVQSFLRHRQKTGRLLSIYELQSIESFDLQTIYNLAPFVTVTETSPALDNRGFWKRLTTEKNNSLIIRSSRTLERQEGYRDAPADAQGQKPARYLGDPNKWFVRYRVSHGQDFSLGFTGEKDAGERVRWSPSQRQYGADFWSAHLMLENRGIFKRVLAGDYQFMFGQGLVYSAGFAVGKGAEPITTVRRANMGLRPYTSVLEGLYFRGAAATLGFRNLEITVLSSIKRLDGNVEQTDDTTETDFSDDFVTSINITGFHRTPSELENRMTNRETMLGITTRYRDPKGRYEWGVLGTTVQYQFPVIRQENLYNRFDFNGSQNQNFSVQGQWNVENLSFFSEAAVSRSGGHAVVAGMVGSLGRLVDFSMVVRDYARNYHAFYSNAFGEATRNQNERGIYWGLKYRLHPRWLLAAYYDRFQSPYLAFQADGPSFGQEYLARLTYTPSKTVSLFFQYRDESKLRNLAGDNLPMDVLVPTRRQNGVIQADLRANKWLGFRMRVQTSRWDQETGARTYGIALSQDVNFDLGKWSISNRFSLFDTEDYNNRQYLYEKNVLYAFSIPALYGRGSRAYCLVQYNATRKLDLWFRIARTWQRDRKTTGSGLEEIDGPIRTDAVLQIRYKI